MPLDGSKSEFGAVFSSHEGEKRWLWQAGTPLATPAAQGPLISGYGFPPRWEGQEPRVSV